MTAGDSTTAPERLTWDEICARYPDQWVLLVECDWIDGNIDNDFRTAVVLAHGPSRDDTFRASEPEHSRYEEFVHEYTGPTRGPWCPIILPLEA